MTELSEKEILIEINENLKQINNKLGALDINYLEEIDYKLRTIKKILQEFPRH